MPQKPEQEETHFSFSLLCDFQAYVSRIPG